MLTLTSHYRVEAFASVPHSRQPFAHTDGSSFAIPLAHGEESLRLFQPQQRPVVGVSVVIEYALAMEAQETLQLLLQAHSC